MGALCICFDVGLTNLAFCVCYIPRESTHAYVVAWNVLNTGLTKRTSEVPIVESISKHIDNIINMHVNPVIKNNYVDGIFAYVEKQPKYNVFKIVEAVLLTCLHEKLPPTSVVTNVASTIKLKNIFEKTLKDT